jgi:hypothetical protein
MSLIQVHRWLMVSFAGVSLAALQGCGSILPVSPQLVSNPPAVWQPEDQLKWEVVKIPGKVPTQYSVVRLSNRSTLMANAPSSASMLRKDLRIEPAQLNELSFSWQIQKLIDGADMALRDQDDSPVRLADWSAHALCHAHVCVVQPTACKFGHSKS